MGVPGLFGALRKRYQDISRPLCKRQDGTWEPLGLPVDNLYVDANHILHSCAHATTAKGRDKLTREQVGERLPGDERHACLRWMCWRH